MFQAQPNPSAKESADAFVDDMRRICQSRPLPQFASMSFISAIEQSKREGKCLLVYLHSPLHYNAEAFCRSVLSNEEFVECANNNFLCWGCDVTSPDGYLTSQRLGVTDFPAVVLVAVTSSERKIVARLEGMTNAQTTVATLMQAVHQNRAMLDRILAEQQQQATEREYQEAQRRQFREAVEADTRREEERQRAAEEQEAAEEATRLQEALLLSQQLDRQQSLERARAKARELGPEPTEGNLLTIRFKLPSGKKLQRKFLATDTFELVRAFVSVSLSDMDQRIDNFNLNTQFPKRSFTEDQSSLTLQEAGLSGAVALFVQDLDS